MIRFSATHPYEVLHKILPGSTDIIIFVHTRRLHHFYNSLYMPSQYMSLPRIMLLNEK